MAESTKFVGHDPWSLDGMSRLRRAIEITLPAKDLGSDLVETYNSIKCLGMV
jgi:hypothetical protein